MPDDPFTDTRARLARLHAAEARWQAAWEAAQDADCPYALLAEQHELAEARRVVLETAAEDLERVLGALDRERERSAGLLDELAEVLAQACGTDDGLDSSACRSYADGIRALAREGRVVLTRELGRSVWARWKGEGDG